MDILTNSKLPLTKQNVQSMAHAGFKDAFDKLCGAVPDSKWLEFDVRDSRSIGEDRAVFRHLKRSQHNRLLVVGSYSPGSANTNVSDRVAAHVHADPAEVRFYRIVERADGARSLEDVNSTSSVDFDPPFCDVGDGEGDHKAGHRVTALIEWFFLDAGLIKELARPDTDPGKFPNHFRQACLWVGNGGRQPHELLPRRSSGAAIQVEEKETIPVRPKRASTISFNRHASEDIRSPTMKRALTDTVQVKRFREEETLSRPQKHRRTLSEQITPLDVINMKYSSTPSSPRTPTLYDAARINKAMGGRIMHLHKQYEALRMNLIATENKHAELQGEVKQMKEALAAVEKIKDMLAAVETRSEDLVKDMKNTKVRLAQLEEEVVKEKEKADLANGSRDSLERKTRGRP